MSTLFTPRPPLTRRKVPSLIDVVLDPTQRAAVEQPAGGALLVLGEAGHGKTTVALHRLAHLWQSSKTPLRASVVVPTEGLVRLIQPLLRKLGVDVEVMTYDRWAAGQARRAFRRLPRESELTPPSVMRFKRHPALRIALEELAKRKPGRIDNDREVARDPTKRVSRGDLQHLFGDRALLERVAAAANLPARAIADVLEHTRIQFSQTAEEEWAHVVDRRRLIAVDGRPLDDGTASELAKTLDAEDYAVLFELERLRAERDNKRPAALRSCDLLLIDEAEELAPLELALLGRSLTPEGTLIVAGDSEQQTDDTATFDGWTSAMRELGRPEYGTVKLPIGYRCPPEVVALARAVVGRGAMPVASPRREASDTIDAGAALVATLFLSFTDEGAQGARLARELGALLESDRSTSVAVVCRSPRTARRVADQLHAAEVPARLVFDGRFLARGPVQVSTVDEVKGLEFDYVIVPDANARDYPDDAAARRAMYVAITRARHQVVLACVGERTSVVPQ